MLIHRRFEDFDALTDMARGWRIELSKLDADPFRGELFQWITPDFILSRGRFDGLVKQAGEPPAGFRTFAVSATDHARFLWRGHEVGGNALLAFPPGGELDAISRSGFDVFTVSVRDEAFGEMADVLACQGWADRCQTLEVLPCEPARMQALRALLRRVASAAAEPGADPVNASGRVLARLVKVAGSVACPRVQRACSTRRLRVVQEAGKYVQAHPLEAPTIESLCGATGVSRRTMEYAFTEHVGVSPKAYVKALRLNSVRRVLRFGPLATGHVADAANAWGFWHMGQFAADYRKLFGELPSETLKG